MKKKSLPLFIGVFISFVFIWFISQFLVVEPCVEKGGTFNYSKGECLLANGDVFVSEIADYLMVLYFVVGIVTAISVSLLIRKVFKIEQ
jgi:hypothetical protein